MTVRIPIGQGARPAFIAGRFANRHGLIAGATGVGKTVTLAKLATGFRAVGTPVFLADVKGDLAPLIAQAGVPMARLDPFINARISLEQLGPDLVSRALALSDAQAGALEIAFAIARDSRRRLDTLADLTAILQSMTRDARALSSRYGHITPVSVATIRRSLLTIEREGMASALGRPSFDIASLMPCAPGGGLVTVLDARRLMESGAIYGAFMLHILAELYARLPEIGDADKPRLVLFLDEAHLLFSDAPPPLISRVERIIRLIRSKSVGVYFATQSPSDLPASILGQLGNRIQHGLRGATPADIRAARAAANSMPINPRIDAASAILSLPVGSALVSVIDESGRPTPCDIVRVAAPGMTVQAGPDYKWGGRPVGHSVVPRETRKPALQVGFKRSWDSMTGRVGTQVETSILGRLTRKDD